MGLAGTRWGGLVYFWQGGGGARGWEMGPGSGEEQLLHFGRAPGLHATEESSFPMPGISGRLGHLSALSQAQIALLCGLGQASGSLWTEAESLVWFPRGLNSEF